MTELHISFYDGEGEIHIVAEGSCNNFDFLKNEGAIEIKDGFVFVYDLDHQAVAYNVNAVRCMTLHYNNKN